MKSESTNQEANDLQLHSDTRGLVVLVFSVEFLDPHKIFALKLWRWKMMIGFRAITAGRTSVL